VHWGRLCVATKEVVAEGDYKGNKIIKLRNT
jgi:hypothetical protein